MARTYGIKRGKRNRKAAEQQPHPGTAQPLTQEEFDAAPPEVQMYFHQRHLQQLQEEEKVNKLIDKLDELEKNINAYQKPGRVKGLGTLLMIPGVALALIIGFLVFWGLCVWL